MADWRSSRFHILGCKLAFTMAEILISLTIIGIIAAITLPSLVGNINEKSWATQRKALYSRMSQAIGMMPSLNGYGVVFENGSINETATASKAAQAFITDGLSKVLKISNVCDVDNFKKCGFPDKIQKFGHDTSKINTPLTIRELNGYFNYSNSYVNYSQMITNNVTFETVNGESILVSYNPNCSYEHGMNNVASADFSGQNLIQPTMCANFIYDLNGRKGPNKAGKDIGFITAFYPTDSVVVAPMVNGYMHSISASNMSALNAKCKSKYGDGSRVPNLEELEAMFINRKITMETGLSTDYISQTHPENYYLRYYYVSFYSGIISSGGYNSPRTICVK